jgi:hypothetical protein
MSRKRSAIPQLSLFPFLAVLLSTMGILVLFLFVSIRIAARSTALDREKSSAAVEEERLEIEAATSLATIRMTGWEEVRARLNERFQSSRIRQTALLGQLDELRAEVGGLEQRLTEESSAVAAGPDGDELEGLQREVEQLQAAIGMAESQPLEQAGQQPAVMYNLVPNQSPGGTLRRPIYVECTGSAVVLQPLGIHLTSADFVAPEMPGNPLDAALNEVRDYWLRNDVAGEAGRPYPLLVVRPDGASAWASARRAMQGWSDEFGYELVNEGMTLNFGPGDPELANRVQTAIDRARQTMAVYQQRRQAEDRFVEAARRANSTALLSGLKASRTGGGFVSSGGQNASRHEAAAIPQQDRFGQEAGGHPVEASQGSGAGSEVDRQNRAAGQDNIPQPNTGVEAGSAGGNQPAPGAEQSDSTGAGQGANATGGQCPCLAESRGSDWAIQKTPQQPTGYRRPIVAWCDGESLRLEPGSLTWLPVASVGLEAEPEQVGDRVAVAVRQIVEGWGAAPENGYWRPELRIRMLDGGEPRLEQLRSLLRDSGIELGEPKTP